MISKPILFGSTGLALLLSGVAFAMPQVPIIPLDIKPGQTYVTVDGQYSGVADDDLKFLDLCPFDGKTSGKSFQGKGGLGHCAHEDKTPFLDASDMNAFGGGGIIGIAGENPWFNGQGQRFELGFAILNGDRSEHRSHLFEDDYDDAPHALTSFDGGECNDNNYNRCGPRHIGIEARLQSDYDAYNIVARTLIDYEVSRNFTITPNFGFVYRHTETTNHAVASWIDEEEADVFSANSYSGGRGFFKRLPEVNELIKTSEIGVELGTTLSFDLSDSLKLFGGVNGEFLYREGHYDDLTDQKKHGGGGCNPGMVSISSPSPSPCNGAGLVNTNSHYNRHDSDDDTDTAINVTLSLGASWRFRGGTTLSVIGYAQNEDHLVVVKDSHKEMDAPELTSEGGGGSHGSHLESERDWTPGVVVALTVPFGGS